MARNTGMFKSEKRKKELKRQKKQEMKKQRRLEKSDADKNPVENQGSPDETKD